MYIIKSTTRSRYIFLLTVLAYYRQILINCKVRVRIRFVAGNYTILCVPKLDSRPTFVFDRYYVQKFVVAQRKKNTQEVLSPPIIYALPEQDSSKHIFFFALNIEKKLIKLKREKL